MVAFFAVDRSHWRCVAPARTYANDRPKRLSDKASVEKAEKARLPRSGEDLHVPARARTLRFFSQERWRT